MTRFARASGSGPWWGLPWDLPWALGPGPSPGPWWGPAGIGRCGALGPGGALRGSGPAGPWALVGPCGDRALRGPGPWWSPAEIGPSPGPWWGPAGIGPCRGPNKYEKLILPTSENIKYLNLNICYMKKTILKVPRPQKHKKRIFDVKYSNLLAPQATPKENVNIVLNYHYKSLLYSKKDHRPSAC